MDAGCHEVKLEGSNLAGGANRYRLPAGAFRQRNCCDLPLTESDLLEYAGVPRVLAKVIPQWVNLERSHMHVTLLAAPLQPLECLFPMNRGKLQQVNLPDHPELWGSGSFSLTLV